MKDEQIKKYCDTYFEEIHDNLTYVEAKSTFIAALKQVEKDTIEAVTRRLEIRPFGCDRDEIITQIKLAIAELEDLISNLNN